MGDLDTDPKMMREQQGRDALETIAPDETREPAAASDSDPQSHAAREAAKIGKAERGDDQMDAVLAQNRRAASPEGKTQPVGERAKAVDAALAQPGRSRLGS